jgi:uncharacterized glyoxalase superfamily protein PhnB
VSSRLKLLGIYVFAKDLPETLAFYRLIGLPIEEVSDVFARSTLPLGGMIEFGSSELTKSYDPEWSQSEGLSNNTINIELESRDVVNKVYSALVEAGYAGHLAPCDAPWQARFAIVDDPNGNPVGLHSPRNVDADRWRERGR